ncbi:hypothetical protein MNBD_GAMMA26-2243 [hydrothermal vent metagenome]|uniref:SPOR domain-containing protein n=1 Tax=hydrothermal vent metagenome TaxID=652676 RepID=A0A3B1AYV5_9ZZZZ
MKKRLVGAIVLASLVVIFVPMLLEDEPVVALGITATNIPPEPKTEFPSHVVPEESRVPLVAAESIIEAVSPAVPTREEQSAKQQPKPVPKARVGLSAWVIQVASFGQRENADKLVKRLQAMKFDAFQEQASIGGKTVFRVRVGPEVDHKKAESMRDLIEKNVQLQGKVERYP